MSKKLLVSDNYEDILSMVLDNADSDESSPCGRPLGMAFDTIGDNLIVMHSLQGVFEVDLKTGKKNQLVSESDIIGNKVRSGIQTSKHF